MALVLLGRHDLADSLALLRGAVRGAAPEERVAAVTLEELGTRLLASLRQYRQQGVPVAFDIA